MALYSLFFIQKRTIMQARKNHLLSILLFIANGLFAQDFQLAGIEYANYAQAKIKDSPTNQTIAFQEWSFFGKLPIKFKNQKTILMNTLRYGLVQPTISNSPLFAEANTQKNLHTATLSLMLIQKMGEKWTLIAGLTPTFASDFEEKLSSDDVLMQGVLLASKKLNDKWSLGGGVVYTTQLGDPRFLPAVQLSYRRDKHLVKVLLPSYVNYLYTVDKSEKWRLGFRLATNGGNFNINNQDFRQGIPNPINKIIQSRVNMGAVIHHRLTKTILFEAYGGISAARKYKLATTSKTYFNYPSENGGFFNLGLFLTPPAKTTERSEADNI
jgi:Domain of unknown function (DUF6268)